MNSPGPRDPVATPAPRVKLRLHDVCKSYRTPVTEVRVLDHVCLEVLNGEFVAIVGPSGCGKTTLLNCLAGFEPIQSGEIRVDGETVRAPSSRRVFVFQEPGIFPWLTVEENIGFGLSGSMAATRRAEIVRRYVDMVGLQGFERAYPGELSGGMKQRVEFARALAVEPDVLYLDEPFGSLDALTRIEMRREIVRIWQATGKTCLLVTHDVEEACELADRIAVLSRRPGRILEVIPNVLSRPRDPSGLDFRNIRDRVFELLGVERRV